MGGFYGSAQVRTEDRNEVYQAVDAVSKKGRLLADLHQSDDWP